MKVGDKVRIVQEPVFIGMTKDGWRRKDMTHLLGVEAVIDGEIPNMFTLLSKEPDIYGYHLDFGERLGELKIPIGLLSEGFQKDWLEKIDTEE